MAAPVRHLHVVSPLIPCARRRSPSLALFALCFGSMLLVGALVLDLAVELALHGHGALAGLFALLLLGVGVAHVGLVRHLLREGSR